MTFHPGTRSYFFRQLCADYGYRWRKAGKPGPYVLTWREARLMFRGATAAAIYKYRAPKKRKPSPCPFPQA